MPKFDANNQPIKRTPRGKDKKWATLEYWFEKLNKDLKDSTLPISDKVKAELKMIELILGRKPLPADTQEDSKEAADKAFKLFEEMNGRSNQTSSNKDVLGDGHPKI